jgi:nucleoside-diphosphate-sugar epimerase
MTNIALVAGANGIIGKALLEEIATRSDWRSLALSRTPHQVSATFACDLTDPAATRAAVEYASQVTHLFYAAYASENGLAAEDTTNTAMLRNLLDALVAAKAPLRRVILYQGAKIYGVHLGPVPGPFYEDDNPRHLGPNFYQSQEDELKRRSAAGGPEWTILRPDVVVGDAAGNAMNIATVIGSFAAITRATGSAFRFPGSEKVYDRVLAQFTDAHALARASLWAALSPAARNEAFNYVHEPFRWRRVWENVGRALDLPLGPPMPLKLAAHMPLSKGTWDRLAADQQLKTPDYAKAVQWSFGDFVFGAEFDVISSVTKIRSAGFNETIGPIEALLGAIKRQQTDRTIPV